MSDYTFRFGGVSRLYGEEGLERLKRSRVTVVGVGGVGSWVVEGLARSGVGAIEMIDLDEVCVSNVNRQLPAMQGTLGRAKVEVLAERIREIHPECDVGVRVEFFTAENAPEHLGRWEREAREGGGRWVVDAIDSVRNKCVLLSGCRAGGIPVVTCGGAGGRRDPTRVRVVDLAKVTHDRLAAEVRRRLRREFGFDREGGAWGIPCVCTDEPVQACGGVDRGGDGGEGGGTGLGCEGGLGSAVFVTGAFGWAAAGWVVSAIARG